MGPGTTAHPARRAWAVEIRPHLHRLVARCRQCGEIDTGSRPARAVVVSHLAWHARTDALAAHLRTCQCGQHGCTWHARHRGCDGPIGLLLTRSADGRVWRLADVCRACAMATENAAQVPEPIGGGAPHTPLPRTSRVPSASSDPLETDPHTADPLTDGGDSDGLGEVWWPYGLVYG